MRELRARKDKFKEAEYGMASDTVGSQFSFRNVFDGHGSDRLGNRTMAESSHTVFPPLRMSIDSQEGMEDEWCKIEFRIEDKRLGPLEVDTDSASSLSHNISY